MDKMAEVRGGLCARVVQAVDLDGLPSDHLGWLTPADGTGAERRAQLALRLALLRAAPRPQVIQTAEPAVQDILAADPPAADPPAADPPAATAPQRPLVAKNSLDSMSAALGALFAADEPEAAP